MGSLAQGLGGIGAAVDGFIGTKSNQFTPSSFINKANTVNAVQSKVENGLLSSGNPYAMAAGAILKGGRAIDNSFRGKNGLYSTGFGKIASSVLNPSALIKNISTGELFHTKRLRRQIENSQKTATMNQINDIAQQGAMAAFDTPKYQAPAYGRKGMKLKTKFTMY